MLKLKLTNLLSQYQKPFKLNVLFALACIFLLIFSTTSNAFLTINSDNSIKITKAQSLIESGDFRQAADILQQLIDSNPEELQTNVLSWEMLGNAFSGQGEYLEALEAYRQSLKLQSSLSTLNNLVKTSITFKKSAKLNNQKFEFDAQLLQDANKALLMADESSTLSSVYAYTNWVKITGKKLNLQRLSHGHKILRNAKESRLLTYALINWGNIVEKNRQLKWLKKAELAAKSNNDMLGLSQVFLNLGNFYNLRKNLNLAGFYANKTIVTANEGSYYNIQYQAEYLAGQIYERQRNISASLKSYKNAIALLELLDKDLYASKKAVEIAPFKDKSRKVYKNAIKLIINNSPTPSGLENVLNISGKLRLTELQSFFGDDCLELVNQVKTKTNTREAVISSIIMEDKTTIILRLPDGSLFSHTTNISSSDLNELVVNWRKDLTQPQTRNFHKTGKFLYDIIIKPIESQLNTTKIETLVFVHDGVLRNIPMNALYDGEKYLVQKWPSISALDSSLTSASNSKQKPKALIFGLSQPKQTGWSELSEVDMEVRAIDRLLDSKKYLNKEFTNNNFFKQLEKKEFYNVVHIASHGIFGNNIQDSFILTYDDKLSIGDLENSLRSLTGIDLLVLSACETSVSSDLSLLSIAGVAARSGVKTTLGSLWQIDDADQSEVITKFYEYWLNPEYSKAQALQKVQIEYIEKFSHPYKWATLNLIGQNS